MGKLAATLGPRISRHVLKLRDRTLLEGAMATSALVAMADGRVVIEENIALASLIENLELLKVYDPHLAISLHSHWVEKMREDFEAGKHEALDAIARCRDDIEMSELLVKVGIAIAKADSVFSDDEVAVVDEICRRVDIAGLDALGLSGMSVTEQAH